MQKPATAARQPTIRRAAAGQKPRARGGGYPRARRPKRGFTPPAAGARGEARPRPGPTGPESGPPPSRPPNIRQCPATARVGYRPTGDERRCYCEGKGCGREVAARAHAQAGAAKPTPAGTGRMAGHAARVGKRGFWRWCGMFLLGW